MGNRRLDLSTGAGGMTAVRRTWFDSHLSDCQDCRKNLCPKAEALWRKVCTVALSEQGGAK